MIAIYIIAGLVVLAWVSVLAFRWLLREADHDITALSDSHCEVRELR